VDAPGLTPPPARPEPKRDRWDRYVIPDPVSGADRAWTRATTWAKTVADMLGLNRWEQRMTALGLAQRPDLLLGVAAVIEPDGADGKRKLDQLIDRAKEHALSKARSNLGTALHSFCEAIDTGRALPLVPPPFDRDVEAYKRMTATLDISLNYVERIGLVHDLGVAGTMDRVVRFKHDPLPMIGDIKTGSDLRYSWQEIAIQLALYAHADTTWDTEIGQHKPMLPVHQDRALVIHLPAGGARCTLYLVDIAAGWEMAKTCGLVRAWRTRKDIAQEVASG
jgi:hypothetical protein